MKWRDVKRILRQYNVTIPKPSASHYKLKRDINGKTRSTIISGHGKDFDVPDYQLNQIISRLEIPANEFQE